MTNKTDLQIVSYNLNNAGDTNKDKINLNLASFLLRSNYLDISIPNLTQRHLFSDRDC